LLLPDETSVFTSRVEARAMRRRASRLIPISVSPLKPKIRQLILTSHRLICVKQRDRGVLSIKCEVVFRPPTPVNGNGVVNGKEKDKDSRSFIIGVETKTEKEFVILTVHSFLSLLRRVRSLICLLFLLQSGKSQTYVTSDASLASTWIEKMTSALEWHQHQSTRTS
jgi:3-phosphoinositide dependent protein kinase-1